MINTYHASSLPSNYLEQLLLGDIEVHLVKEERGVSGGLTEGITKAP